MSRPRAWLLGLLLLVAAWFVAAATPDGEARITDPFPVAASPGTPAVGDNIAVTIHDVVVSDGVTSETGWSATGTWLVVDLDAWAVKTETRGALGAAYLVLADRTLSASERPGARNNTTSLLKARLHVGVPQSGSIAFELPADVTTGTAVLQVAQNNGAGATDPSLSLEGDSAIQLPLVLKDLDRVTARELRRTDWVTP